MIGRYALALACFVATALAVAPPASAQEMSFGEEEVAPVAASGPYPKFLEEGKKLYENKNYDEASLLFFKIVDSGDVNAEAIVPEAEYELAKTLYHMGLYQGALTFFGRIVDAGETHPYYLQALRGLVLLTDAIPGDPTLMDRLATYVDYFPKDVPEKYRDTYAYLVGRHFYRQVDVDNALKLLNYVSARSDLYPKAKYITAITHIANYDAPPAVDAFKEVLRYLTRIEEGGGELDDEQERLRELTELGMARTFYSTGDYETSLKYYSKIPRESTRWPQALFESSWAYFQVDKYNHALGNLHSLNSPFFADDYFPEGPILSSVIFFYNCKFDRVRYELDEFEYYYVPLKDDMSAILADHPDPPSMYEWIKKVRAGEGEFDPKLRRILDAALDDKQLELKVELVGLIRKEIEKIESMPDAWKSSPLGTALMQEATLAESFAIDDAGALAQQRLQRVQRELEDLIVQQKQILFEVARSEKGNIEADVRAGMAVSGNVTDKRNISVSDEQMYWTFDGEYWKDELGSYVFNINSECKR